MLKKAVIVTILAAAPVSFAHACIVSYTSATNVVHRALEGGWGFKNYEKVCSKLNAANASLQISAQTTVLGGVAIAWASVALKDKNLDIFTHEFAGASTTTNTTPSMSAAEEILPQTISAAVDLIDLDRAIASLNANRKKTRAAYQKK